MPPNDETMPTTATGPGGAPPAWRETGAGRCPGRFVLGPSSGAIRCERVAGHDVGWHRSERHRFEWNETELWPLPVDACISRAVATGVRRTGEPGECPADGGRSRGEAHAA